MLALRDGFTTGSGLGLGLGGAKRLCSEFSIESTLGKGTRVQCTRWKIMIESMWPTTAPWQRARRRALATGAAVGLDDARAGSSRSIATELATNLVEARRRRRAAGRTMASTMSTCWRSIGAAAWRTSTSCLRRRLSRPSARRAMGSGRCGGWPSAFHVASWPDRGTAVLRAQSRAAGCRGAAACRRRRPERGHARRAGVWRRLGVAHQRHRRRTLFVVDGLGHGVEAARAANEALQQFHRSARGAGGRADRGRAPGAAPDARRGGRGGAHRPGGLHRRIRPGWATSRRRAGVNGRAGASTGLAQRHRRPQRAQNPRLRRILARADC